MVLLKSALTPLAVLSPVLLKSADSAGGVVACGVEKSALTPLAVLKSPVVLQKSASGSDGGVVAARGVVLKCACPQTGVALRRSNPRQREREYERNNKDGEKPSRRMAKHIIPSLFK